MITVPHPEVATHVMLADESTVRFIVYSFVVLFGSRVATSISTPPAGDVMGAPFPGTPVTGVGFGLTLEPVIENVTRFTALSGDPTRSVIEGALPRGVKT